MHYREGIHKVAGNLCFSKVLYSHYFWQHTKAHHKLVGTDDDANSAPLGQSIYGYYSTILRRTKKAAWRVEYERLTRANKSPYSLLEN